MAILAGAGTAASAVGSVTGWVGGLFGHPEDNQRRATADALYQRAVAGDASALRQLKCLGGDQAYNAEFNAGAAGCGFATQATRSYAASLAVKAEAVLAGNQVAGDAVTGYVQPALSAAGYSIVPTPTGTTFLLVAAALVGGYLLLRKG